MEVNYVKKTPIKLTATIVVLGMCWAIVYLVPFLQYTWYDPFKEYLGTSNFRMSLLLTIYGFGNVIGCPIGGWVADHFNYKWIYVLSVALNGALGFIFCLFPSYGAAVAIWIGYAVTSLFMNYPTHIKIVRDLASDENQGKIFGVNETCIGIGNIAISAIMNFAFIKMGAGIGGLKGAVIANAILSLVLAVLIAFLLDDPRKTGMINKKTDDSEKANFKRDFSIVAKHPETWFYALTIFSVYSFMSTLSYFTPYFTSVLGVTVVFSAWMSIMRQYGMQLFGSPLGGAVSDKIKSPAKLLYLVYIVGFLGFVALLTVKSGWTVVTIIALTMFISFFVYMGRGCYYATLTEVGVPRRLSATTVGVGAMIGFSPDIFQFAMYGHWLDTVPAADAYTRIFIYQLFVLAIGFFAATRIRKAAKKYGTVNGGTYEEPVLESDMKGSEKPA